MLLQYLASDFRQGIRARLSEIDDEVRSFVNSSIKQLRASGSRGVVNEEVYGIREFARLALLQKHLNHLTPAQPAAASSTNSTGSTDLRFLKRILGQAKATVETWQGRLLFVYLPAYEMIRRGEAEPRRDAVLEIARELDLKIIDIDALFRARADPLDLFPFNQDGVHYTEEGNRLIAEEIIRAIEAR